MTRFSTYWDGADERLSELEEHLGQAETEASILREFVEEACDLLKEATFDNAGDHYDTMHLLAEIDRHFEEAP